MAIELQYRKDFKEQLKINGNCGYTLVCKDKLDTNCTECKRGIKSTVYSKDMYKVLLLEKKRSTRDLNLLLRKIEESTNASIDFINNEEVIVNVQRG